MNKKDFTKLLRKRYINEASVKAIRAGKMRPNYENIVFFTQFGVPFNAWLNIRAWLKEQEAKALLKRAKKAKNV